MKKSLFLLALLPALAAPAWAQKIFIDTAGAGGYLPPPPPTAASQGVPPGLYVHVLDGHITFTNAGGTQQFAAGQFGYTSLPITPPVVLPANPGLQFSPPPAFNTSLAGVASANTTGSKVQEVDCTVR